MISLAGVFLGVLGMLALPVVGVVCLGAISWTLLGTRAREYLVFLSKKTHVTDIVLFLLDVTKLVCGWM